jgi:hypothetical protein
MNSNDYKPETIKECVRQYGTENPYESAMHYDCCVCKDYKCKFRKGTGVGLFVLYCVFIVVLTFMITWCLI